MIPSIQYDFNFDIVLGMIFISYLVYGYFSGGHKQIRLSINLILPFMVIYYLGSYITSFMYIPLKSTFFFEIIDTYLPAFKNTIGMVFAYVFTYIMLFLAVFLLSIYARKYVLNENMRAKLGKKNNYIGALFAFINGYVLVYFIASQFSNLCPWWKADFQYMPFPRSVVPAQKQICTSPFQEI